LPSPIDPEATGVIGWALSGIGTAMAGLVAFLYRRLRKLSVIETNENIEQSLLDFENRKIVPVLKKLEDRVTNLEKLDARLGAMQADMGHLTITVETLHKTVEKNAAEASRELTGAMNRLSDQRKEDRENQAERFDSLKELIEAKIQ